MRKRISGSGVQRCSVFAGGTLVASGPVESVCRALRQLPYQCAELVAVDESTGHPVSLAAASDPARGGRPRLGVVSRTVQLLPRHWDWLDRQPGGVSAYIRTLVERDLAAAVAANPNEHAAAAIRRFASALRDPPANTEDVAAAVARGNLPLAMALMHDWPTDVRTFARRLARLQPPGSRASAPLTRRQDVP